MKNKRCKPLNTIVAESIRRLRKEQSISQEELALRAELDRTYVSSVERNRRNITIGSLQNIIDSLGISEEDFLKQLIKQINMKEEK